MKNVILAITFILFYTFSNAQSLAVNTDGSTANASSILDVKSTAKGVLIPRMSKAEKNAIAVPANGLLVYQNAPDSVGFHYYNGVEWLYLLNHKTDSLSWKTNGNYITGNKFIGTLNDSAFKIKVNNQPSGIVDSINQNTSIGFGTLRNLKSTGFPNGMFNTAIGYKALDSTTFGSFNNAFGGFALHNNTIGYYNTAIGSYSQFNNKKGNFNSAFGHEAMLSTIMGSGNVALGYGSLYHSDSASNNVAIGQRSLSHFNDVGNTDNIAIGSQSMFNLNTGIWNSIVGADAMYYANN
ncbi:MAG: hypothetical protein IPP48_16385 [Chitinophagaceae bacterium]|nr:hypothetical protein [Chitinophagaceae bacterium]